MMVIDPVFLTSDITAFASEFADSILVGKVLPNICAKLPRVSVCLPVGNLSVFACRARLTWLLQVCTKNDRCQEITLAERLLCLPTNSVGEGVDKLFALSCRPLY